jgi:hypothetical protein
VSAGEGAVGDGAVGESVVGGDAAGGGAVGEGAAGEGAAGGRRHDRSGWSLLLAVPVLAVLWPPLYNRADPHLFGLPFFYWYQLAVIPVGVACTLAVYFATRGARR